MISYLLGIITDHMYDVLILGSGMVAKPIIEYLSGKGFRLTIATPLKERADELIKGSSGCRSVLWSMDEKPELEKMIREHRITVSLLPPRFHTEVARVCLANLRPMVTTSYIQPEMEALNPYVKEAGIIFLNEAGLDPGIDHMSAMKIIDQVKNSGGKIEKFCSVCGALPAPEAAGNPLGYKFTWSPEGVIMASRSGARYLKDGKEIIIEGTRLFTDRFETDFPELGRVEVYPNRDSVNYIGIYGIDEVKTMYRGTIRFKGWCETLDVMKRIRMLDDFPVNYEGKRYSDFISESAGLKQGDPARELAEKLSLKHDSVAIKALEWLGFFEKDRIQLKNTTPFRITSERMISKMLLEENERDMIALMHLFLVSDADGKKQVIRSSMLDFGTPSVNTSIARTVALPAAIAVRLILSGQLKLTGVVRPVMPEIYLPVLKELESLGIRIKEEYGLQESEMIV